MANIDVSMAGKLQSTGYVSVTIKSASQDIDALYRTLLADAEAEWTTHKAQWNVLAYNDKNLFEQGLRYAFGMATNRLLKTVYKEKFDKAIANKTGAALRTRCNEIADEYYKDFAKKTDAAVNQFASNSKTIMDFEHVGFKVQSTSLINAAATDLKKRWQGMASTFSKVFDQRYKNASPDQAWKVMLDVVEDQTTYGVDIIDGYQRRVLDALGADLRASWKQTYYMDRLNAIETSMEATQAESRSSDVYLTNDGTLIKQALNVPTITTIRPFDVMTVEAEDSPLLRGYPRKPQLWARATPNLTSSGSVVSSNRARPDEIELTSRVRWVAGEDYWDGATGTWVPIHDELGYRIVSASLVNQPVTVTTTKVVGKEAITRDSVRIADGASLNCNFGLDTLGAFTLSMVIAPNPGDGAYPILDWLGDYDSAKRFAWWIDERLDYYYGDMGGSVDPLTTLSKMRPMVITSSVSQGICTTYVGYSPKHIFSTSIAAKTSGAQRMVFQIGGSELEHSVADFNIFEFNLWTTALTTDDVVALHSNYYSVYGTTDDWR